MKHKTTSTTARGEGDGIAGVQPLPVSDALIARLAGKCEEIFPLKDRCNHEISDQEIQEIEVLLKRLKPLPVNILFREQCCSLMCAESEREMEGRLLKLTPAEMPEFSEFKMAAAMTTPEPENMVHAPVSRSRKGVVRLAGISVAAALVAVLVFVNVQDPGSGSEDGQALAEQDTPPVGNEERQMKERKASIFEMQGGDQRVPVLAPEMIRKIVPSEEY